LEEGKVSVKAVDAACRRILEAKYKLGLFDNPYKYCDITRPKKQIFTKEHRAIARKTASESEYGDKQHQQPLLKLFLLPKIS